MKKRKSKEYVIKVDEKNILIDSFICALMWSLAVYVCLTLYIDDIIELLNSIYKVEGSALFLVILLFVLIFGLRYFIIRTNVVNYRHNIKSNKK